MSHQIDTIAFKGETPWHGLGVRCADGMGSEEFFEKAGLGWRIEKHPLYFANGEKVPDAEAVFRADRGTYFATVGTGWTPFQNETMRSLCDALTIDGQSIPHTAGSLVGGKRVWCLMQCEGQIKVRSDDVLYPFLLVSNAHDGSRALRVQFTTVRVVCANTESMALSEKTQGIYLRHTAQLLDANVVVEKARGALNLAYDSFEEQGQVAVALADNRMTLEDARNFFGCFLAGTDSLQEAKEKLGKLEGAPRTKLIAKGTRLIELFQNGRGNNGQSKWDAYNAVVEFIDYQHARSSAWQERQRALGLGKGLESAWFGEGASNKQRALRLLRKV